MKKEIDITLSKDELTVFYNCLNEVCHALGQDDFETRIGSSFNKTRELLDKIGWVIKALDRISTSNDEIKTAIKLDEIWLQCPDCMNAWMSDSHEILVVCPHCNTAFLNPSSA